MWDASLRTLSLSSSLPGPPHATLLPHLGLIAGCICVRCCCNQIQPSCWASTVDHTLPAVQGSEADSGRGSEQGYVH